MSHQYPEDGLPPTPWGRYVVLALAGVFGFLSIGAIVGAIALANLDFDLDVDLDAPRELPHRSRQPAEVCLPLWAVRSTAEDTWHVTEPVLYGELPAKPAAARRRVHAALTKFEAALLQAKRVAPRPVRAHLEVARKAAERGRRDAVADVSFATWRDYTSTHATEGYLALSEGGLALGDACGFDLKPAIGQADGARSTTTDRAATTRL
jgi:hypothetical protein